MPRSIWNGTITFGSVNVPIKLYSAIESKTVHFTEVHAKEGANLEHRRICPKEDREINYDEVVKGYEVSPGQYVLLEKEEVKAAAGDHGKVVHLRERRQSGNRCRRRRWRADRAQPRAAL